MDQITQACWDQHQAVAEVSHLEEGCLRGVKTRVPAGHHHIVGCDQANTRGRTNLVLHDLVTQLQCTHSTSGICAGTHIQHAELWTFLKLFTL